MFFPPLLLPLILPHNLQLPPGRGGRPLFAQELGMLTPSKPGEGSDKIPLGAAGASDVSSGAEDAGVSTNSSGTEVRHV